MTHATADAGPYGNSAAIRLLRLGLAASQRLWPALADRAALRLFATPVPWRRKRRRPDWGRAWQVEQWPFERNELTLYTRASAAPGHAVLLVHGWGGHAGQMLALADALSTLGLQPVLLEMPAHGLSRGGASNLPQFARAVEYAAAQLQQRGHTLQLLVAHSLGANAAAHAVSRGLPVQGLVLLAPTASPHEYTRLFARLFGLTETTRARMQERIEAREGVLMTQFEPAAVGPRIRLPTLVVHDRGDRINRFADGEAYSRTIAGARLHATEGLGHGKILRDAGVLARVAGFAGDALSAAR